MESIPECLTDEEALDNEEFEISLPHKRSNEPYKRFIENVNSTKPSIQALQSKILNPKGSININSSLNVITENNVKSEFDPLSKSKEKTKNERLSVSLVDLTKFNRYIDNGHSKASDKELPFANSITLSDTNVERLTSTQNPEDYIGNTRKAKPYQNNLPQPSHITDFDFETEKSSTHLNTEISKKVIAESDHSNIGKVNSEIFNASILTNKWGSELNVPNSFPSRTRQRSGSVQWIHNAFHNVEQKCRDFLEIRRPSDIVEQQMRKSNEDLEMEISEDESSKFGPSSSTSGRRFSENILGKKLFPFSTGIVHLRELWKERNVNKRCETKDIDQTRPDVCPLFTFPKNVDEDEMILDSLRQAMRKCTAVDPTVRPASASVLEQLSSLLK